MLLFPVLFVAIILGAAVFYWIVWTELLGASWLPMPRKRMENMIKLAGITKHDVFYDLGCGDGRILKLVAEKTGAKCIGIEADPIRYIWAKINTMRNKNVKILFGNIFKKDISNGSVIFLYLQERTNEKIKTKLRQELRKGTKIASYWWPMKNWIPLKTDSKSRIFLYRI